MKRTILFLITIWSVLGLAQPASADAHRIRVGSLSFGTVAWELGELRNRQLASDVPEIQIKAMASHNGTRLALRTAEVDVIVSDWTWVVQQNAQQDQYRFFPFATVGSKFLWRNSGGVSDIQSLRGKRIGVAGGKASKTWLLYRQWCKQQGLDLERDTELVFASPPTLNALYARGELDALITYWHFANVLIDSGARVLNDLSEVLFDLQGDADIPVVGWAFRKQYVAEHTDDIKHFLRAVSANKMMLARDEQFWFKKSLPGIPDKASLRHRLQADYARGIPRRFDADMQAAMLRLLTQIYPQMPDLPAIAERSWLALPDVTNQVLLNVE